MPDAGRGARCDASGRARAHHLGATALFEGHFLEACEALERSSAMRNRWLIDGVAFSDTLLAWARCRMGEVSDAIALVERAEQTLDDVEING